MCLPPSAELGELLLIDLFNFPGAGGRVEPYLLSIESQTGHILVYRVASKTSELLQTTVGCILAFYTGHGHTDRVPAPTRSSHSAPRNRVSCETGRAWCDLSTELKLADRGSYAAKSTAIAVNEMVLTEVYLS